MASLFADRLSEDGSDLGTQLRALVFLVIAATVVVQGATAGTMARLLGVRRPAGRGFALFGAQPLGRLLARLLHRARARGRAASTPTPPCARRPSRRA